MKSRFLMFAAFCLLWAGIALAQVNINTATKEELDSLKGIGEARADAIIKYRSENGPFKSVSELKNIPNFPDSLVGKLRGKITVGNSSRAPAAAPVGRPAAEAPKPAALPPARPMHKPAAPAMPGKPMAETKAAPAAEKPAAPAKPAMPGKAASEAKPAAPAAPMAKPAVPATKPAGPAAPAAPAKPAQPAQPAAVN